MIPIDDKIVSDDLLEVQFACNLDACKGGCCTAPGGGAPLGEEETGILDDIFEIVEPLLPEQNRALLQKTRYELFENGFKTPLMPDDSCAFAIMENGTAKCSIEKAYEQGLTDFQKPVSCHLYPVRVKTYDDFTAVNYDRWEICQPACTLGSQLGVPVFRFAKDGLMRKFGKGFFNQLESEFASRTDNSK